MDNEELIPQLNALVLKTIAEWEFESGDDYAGQGIRLRFTDGTTFTVYENQTAGEVVYFFGER
jgi:hypothetical protein